MKSQKSVHLMGICGTAMGSLAGLLQAMGHNVRGSDQNIYPPMSDRLKKLGIEIRSGYKPENLEPRPDLVIVGNVMSRTHSEVQALLASDIPYMSLPQAMGEFLIKDRHSIVIAGTHGKTTTTALAAWIAESAGLKPGFLIGGIPLNFPESFSIGEGQFFVIEGDEYDTAFFDKVPKFIHYRPKSVILTSIEFDHADIYRDLDHVKEAFTKLLALIPIDGHLVYNGEDENILSLLNHSHSHSHSSYGQNKKICEWTIDGIEFFESHSQFDVLRKGKKEDTIKCQLMGEYNLMNALSVYVLARQLGLDRNAVLKSFESFRGVKRRQEVIGTPGGITVIDDFAHHPTAVKLTIEGVKKRFTKGKVFGVFEPRSATARRKIFQNDFAEALCQADVIVLSEPYDQTKIPIEDRFDALEVIRLCQRRSPSKECLLGHSTDEIVGLLKSRAKPGDVILFMSNGGFGGIYTKILQSLSS